MGFLIASHVPAGMKNGLSFDNGEDDDKLFTGVVNYMESSKYVG